ncbi:uncharacterized protein N7482_002584 [Penicillium canariense]|uniref:Uncharacterized protein n=1 Tax=Penicillium canariense TaxID=189055 RepID=A0A9W9IHU3_9EURO|nr:uncharacterized protein N7482_002584 [Penicillium canariense]KAJ5176707.1 hypothetical protein N7482_002584 [Penicillium canariense]
MPTHPSTASASLSRDAGSAAKKFRMEVKTLRAQVAVLAGISAGGCIVGDVGFETDVDCTDSSLDDEDMGRAFAQ